MAEIGHLVVVLGDVREQLDHDGRIVVLELLPVEHVVLIGRQVLLEDARRDAVRDVTINLRVVAPHAQIVHRAADNLVPNEAVFGRCLDGSVLAQNLHHVDGEREVRHAGVARDLVAAVSLGVRDAHVGVAVDRAAVAAVHLDGVLLGLGTLVLGGLHAAVANRVDLARFRLAGLDRVALGVGPVQALASGPTGALVVVFSPFLLGGRHDVVVVGADDFAQHVVGQVGQSLRILHVHGAAALDDERLEFLRAHDGAEARACGVVAGIHHAGIGE